MIDDLNEQQQRVILAMVAVMKLETDQNCIRVWAFHDAPKDLQALSGHGGDEDWLALIPSGMVGQWIPWTESGTAFGCCDVSEHQLPDGRMVRIGAHT